MAKSKADYWLTTDGLTLLKGWARDGLSDEQIAHNMEIVPSTLYEWKKKHPKISESLKKNKAIADYEIENALFKSAKSGNVTAMIFWLKNRKSDKWREKVEPVSSDEKLKEINKNISNIANMINNPQKNRIDKDV